MTQVTSQAQNNNHMIHIKTLVVDLTNRVVSFNLEDRIIKQDRMWEFRCYICQEYM